jgi:hypothetical protein
LSASRRRRTEPNRFYLYNLTNVYVEAVVVMAYVIAVLDRETGDGPAIRADLFNGDPDGLPADELTSGPCGRRAVGL